MAPRPSPETQPFWDGCAAGVLRMQRCRPCGELYFPPRPACPRCLSDDVKWETLSGRGTLHTYLINHRAAPGFEPPYAIAVVQLDEGPRMMSNIVGVEQTPEALVLDMELQVTFEERGSVMLPLFTPAGERS
ncbi:MAG: Zn-ribbon domain-containing OB-fold protein [Actinomycetota bacterium]